VFLAYQLALAWPGDPVRAIRCEAALFSAASALALFTLVRALARHCAGAVAALLLVFASADRCCRADREHRACSWRRGFSCRRS